MKKWLKKYDFDFADFLFAFGFFGMLIMSILYLIGVL